MRGFFTTALAGALTLASCPGSALGESGPARLVIDFADGPQELVGQGGKAVVVGDAIYFPGFDRAAGEELWKSDGTPEGTVRVADICPGRCGSLPPLWSGFSSQGFFIRGPVAVGETLFFEADDGVRGNELWRTDGTPEGTFPVGEFDPYLRALHGIEELTAWRDRLYYLAADRDHGRELWRAGELGGAELVVDLAPGSEDSRIARLVAGTEALFFSAFEDRELWASDGTESGTRKLLQVQEGAIEAIFAAGEGVLFTLRNPDQSRHLWTSDGTAGGTVQIRDLGDESAANLMNVAGLAFFETISASGFGLWVSDGSTGGTVRLGDAPGPVYGPFTSHQGGMVFAVEEELWHLPADGSPALLESFEHEIESVTVAGERLFVVTEETPNGPSFLWRSLGPAGPFEQVGGSFPLIGDLTAFGNRAFFFAVTAELGHQAATVDPDGAVTWLTKLETPPSSDPAFLTDHEGSLLFSTRDGLFKSSGTAESTSSVPGPGPFARPESVADTVFAFDIQGLWSMNRKGRGAMLLRSHDRSFPSSAEELDGRLYYVSKDQNLFRLWTSDGTAPGTALVETFDFLFSPPCGSFFGCRELHVDATVLGNDLILLLEDDVRRSDGQPNGTEILFDLADPEGGCPGCTVDHLTRVGDRFFFTSSGLETSTVLWMSDGTAAGTLAVRELLPPDGNPLSLLPFELSPLPPAFREPMAWGDRLVFVLRTPESGEELWVSDGTAAGTHLLVDLRPGAGSSYPRDLLVEGDELFFAADDGMAGRELWASDGTAEGTRRVADLFPGPGSSYPRGLTSTGNLLLFAARDGVHGLEPWKSRGTPLSTRQIQDLVPGPEPSDPRSFTLSGRRVDFNAYAEGLGFELWTMPESLLTDPLAAEAFAKPPKP